MTPTSEFIALLTEHLLNEIINNNNGIQGNI
jgi:hypothetical protein